MMEHLIENIAYNCYKIMFIKNIFRKHNEPNTKDLPYIHCIMPSLPALQSAKREYQSSIKLGYLQGLCPFKVVQSLVYCLAHIAHKIPFITNLSSIFHTYDLWKDMHELNNK